MNRKLSILALALVVSAAVTLVASTPHGLAQSPSITVSPAAGSQFEVFTFVGQGFAPGTELEEWYYSPDGQRFTAFIGGVPAVLVVGSDGTFVLDVYPATDFEGASAGTWVVEFCIAGTGTCWSGTIEISA